MKNTAWLFWIGTGSAAGLLVGYFYSTPFLGDLAGPLVFSLFLLLGIADSYFSLSESDQKHTSYQV